MSIHFNAWGQPVGPELPLWTPRPWPQAVVLQGKHCRLVPLRADAHAAALYQTWSETDDGRGWSWMSDGPFLREADFIAYAARLESCRDAQHFTVICQTSSRPLGTLALMRIDTASGVMEVGHVAFTPVLQRTWMATEAHFLLMQYAFDTLGYRRVEWKCDSLNRPSRRAAERLGFRYEGTFRQALVYKGRSRDTDWLSLLDSEWPANRTALLSWLAEDNRDAEGQQRRPLRDFRNDESFPDKQA
ncbi:GNAT family N-acetyltransferase [Pantoea sp. 1.19]|uniref:GNAT family N-acetyltransferase n=1 Tax=Pantoea sp. 1.19 TaxID=1925589 RepID=UPI000948B236|nr:GNAT family protein [Pantoea sp. 1.19]